MIVNLEAEDDDSSDNSDEDNVDMVPEEFELTFAGGDSSKAFNEFKEMLKSGCTVEQIGIYALRIMELMQLGCIEKGLESIDLKFKSLTARWYGCKTKKVEKKCICC
jgi:hypothetical protein